MKLTKSDLKAVVKECLVELLSEGIGGVQQAKPTQKQPQRVLQAEARSGPPAVKRPSTGNSIFDDILADTARTTLPNMLKAEASKSMPTVGRVETLVESSTPQELFGDEAASKWAALAFAAPTKNT